MKHKKTIDSLEEYLEDDPTDELPILSEAAVRRMRSSAAPEELGVEDTGERPVLRMERAVGKATNWTLLTESSSLQRLEDEFQTLQARWSSIEEELRQRDTEVSRLQTEMQARGSAIEALEDELSTAITARQNLEQADRRLRETQTRHIGQLEKQQQELEAREAELQHAHRERDEARQQLVALDEQIAQDQTRKQELRARETELQQVRQELDDARRELASLDEQVSLDQTREQELQAEAATQLARAQDLEQVVHRGRQRLQDLETYIEGRRSRWIAMQAACERQTRLISSLEKAAGAKEQQLARHRQAQLQLQQAVNGLERQLVQFRTHSRSAEAETQEQIIRLAAREQELGELNQQLSEQHAAAESMQQKIDDKSSRIEELSDELSSATKELASARDELEATRQQATADDEAFTAERARSEALLEQLAALEHRFDAAQLELEQRTEHISSLDETAAEQTESLVSVRDELIALKADNQRLTDVVEARDAQASELQSKAQELEAQREVMQTEIAEQRQTIATLESELQAKTMTIEDFGRDMDKLGDLEAQIQRLDAMMARTADPSSKDEEAAQITRVMVAINGERAVKYPLYKSLMTIGRSPDSDIQIRRQYISRCHAKLLTEQGETYIEDMGSKNGVVVNAERVKRHKLSNGDLVDLGKIQFKFIDLLAHDSAEGSA